MPVGVVVGLTLNTGALFRWIDFNDAFYGRTVIHPSDTYGGILPVADWLSRTRVAQRREPLLLSDVLDAGIKAYEVMGGLAIENGFTDVGLDHTILVKIAVTAVVTRMLGGTREEIVNAVSNAWLDGHALAAFRRKPNTGSRKSWAAGDAASRGVRLALMAVRGEMGYPAALTAKRWGFYEVLFKGKPFKFQRPFGTYVMENTLFKIPYPTAFHGQTGVEAAIKLHPLVKRLLVAIETYLDMQPGVGEVFVSPVDADDAGRAVDEPDAEQLPEEPIEPEPEERDLILDYLEEHFGQDSPR